MIILCVYGAKLTLEIAMIDTMETIAMFWFLVHLLSAIFVQSNITVSKDLCFVILTKPPSTETCFVFVWKAASQSMLLKSCHVHLL